MNINSKYKKCLMKILLNKLIFIHSYSNVKACYTLHTKVPDLLSLCS
jgi:hypothetical protein